MKVVPSQTTLKALGIMAVSGAMHFLGFAGFAWWPLTFVSLVPAMLLLHQSNMSNKRLFLYAWVTGYVTEFGGFYWLINTLMDFSSFALPVCIAIASIFFIFQGLQIGLVLFAWKKLVGRGAQPTLALMATYVLSEMFFPMLFEHYYGNSLHLIPPFMQMADLGGPMLVTALIMLVQGTVFETWHAWKTQVDQKTVWPKRMWVASLLALIGSYGYGVFRISSIETEEKGMPNFRVGIIQANMGLLEKREDPYEGRRRYIEQSLQMESQAHPDLLVWPESALSFFLPRNATSLSRIAHGANKTHPGIQTPILFGGLRTKDHQTINEGKTETEEWMFNSAFLTGHDGRVLGTYDKTYLLAFGEYLPFSDWFPFLHELSPRSGQFHHGTSTQAMILPDKETRHSAIKDVRIGTMICYEDILPDFVRKLVHDSKPDLLVNITNDSWFGNTQEPWVHLALAKSRAVEHRRWLVRATNSGVSTFIDSLGRQRAVGKMFERDAIVANVKLRKTLTIYAKTGNWVGGLAMVFVGSMFWRIIKNRPKKTTSEP